MKRFPLCQSSSHENPQARESGFDLYDGYGAGPASRFGNLTAGLLSFELDWQAADFRENPGSAKCGHSRQAAMVL